MQADPDRESTDSKETAETCHDMHSKRITSFGIIDINAKIFDINSDLTHITKGPLNTYHFVI
ncbi:YdhR family protein [Bacillus altitudinis]|uniref:YdhR family protein n=1 Tax=Bacillus altitudinis TaxID=293387 RepID=UPI0038163579